MELLSPEAFAHLSHFVQSSWAGPVLCFPGGPVPGVPFTEQDLASAFARLNMMKSTVPGSCPNACLKANPVEVASQLHAPPSCSVVVTESSPHPTTMERWVLISVAQTW